MRARPVGMRLLVGADRELRDVAVERALGEVEADVAAAGAALLRRDQRQVDRVRHEVRRQQEALGLVLGGEIIRLAVEAALEVVLGAEDEIQVLVEIDDDRRVGHRDEARRIAARAVEVLVPAVERDGEQRAGLPLEGDALAGVVPHRGRAAAAQDHDGFFEQLPLRAERLARRDLADVAVVRGARGLVVHEHAAAAAPRPGLQLDGVQARHVGRADQVEPFALHPAGVGRLLFGSRISWRTRPKRWRPWPWSALRWMPGRRRAAAAPTGLAASCSSIWNDVPGFGVEGTIRAAARANACRRHACDMGSGEMPHGRPGDMSLPAVPKSRPGQSQKQSEGRNDEGFSEQARGAAARRYRPWGRSAGVPQASARAIRRATSPRSSRSRPAMPTTSPRASCSSSCRQAARPADRHRQAPGAGGTIGVGQAARATPDGYTILFHSASFSASYVTHKTLPYDTFNDFIAGGAGRHFAERAGGRAVEGLQDRRRSDRRRQGQAGRAELRLRRHRRGLASGGRKIPRRGRDQGPARSVQRSGRSADRGDGRADRLLFPAARAGDGADQGRQGHGAGGQLRQARAALPDVPTTAEIGLPKAAYAFWNGVFVPVKTPHGHRRPGSTTKRRRRSPIRS